MKQRNFGKRRHFVKTTKVATVICVCLLSLSLSILANGCGSDRTKVPTISSKNDWLEAGLKGKVQNYKLYDLSYSDPLDRIVLISSSPQLTESKEFFESGHIASYYDGYSTQVFSEFNNGQIECNTYVNNQSQWVYTAYYDQEGKIEKIEGKDDEDNDWIHVYQYDNNTVEISSHEPTYETESYSFAVFDKYKWKHVEKYNKHGKIIESVHYGSFGEIQWSEKFKYDSNGNKILWMRYDSNGSLEWKVEFKYDSTGNEIEYAEYDSGNDLLSRCFYRYISEDQLTCCSDSKEKCDFTTILTSCYDPNASKDYPESFDAKGNWTIRMTLEPTIESKGTLLEVKKIEKRVLEYYLP